MRYDYETAAAADEFRHWRTERELATLEARPHGLPLKLASIWWALRTVTGAIRCSGRPRSEAEPFVVTLTVEGPASGLTPGLLKTILDGTICGLQSETDAALAEAVAPIIARAIGVSSDAVRHALLDDGPSALGPRRRFIHAHGGGVKWEPADDRCMAARVLFSPAETWLISGVAATATATNSPRTT